MPLYACAQEYDTTICVPQGKKIKCLIQHEDDCEGVPDLPYVQRHCYDTFLTSYKMVDRMRKRAKIGERHMVGFMEYYVTQVDGVEQTQWPCMRQPLPWRPESNVSPGKAVCKLVAYASSIGSVPRDIPLSSTPLNPVGQSKKLGPLLLSLSTKSRTKLLKFKSDSKDWSSLSQQLGADAVKQFKEDYPNFDATRMYVPSDYIAEDPMYYGIGAGGGGGFGAEVYVDDKAVFGWGGAGGAGMTSNKTHTNLGGGGGGGANFCDGSGALNGLGLGTGTGTGSDPISESVGFSYYKQDKDKLTNDDKENTYNATLINLYSRNVLDLYESLGNLIRKNYNGFFYIEGGGGMGAGDEFFKQGGGEYDTYRLSTQAGFYFKYEFSSQRQSRAHLRVKNEGLAALYQNMGTIRIKATRAALETCGGYDNYRCVCDEEFSYVLKEATTYLRRVPDYLSTNYCPKS